MYNVEAYRLLKKNQQRCYVKIFKQTVKSENDSFMKKYLRTHQIPKKETWEKPGLFFWSRQRKTEKIITWRISKTYLIEFTFPEDSDKQIVFQPPAAKTNKWR